MNTAQVSAKKVVDACDKFLFYHNARINREKENAIAEAMLPRGWFKRTRTREEAINYLEGNFLYWVEFSGSENATKIKNLRKLALLALQDNENFAMMALTDRSASLIFNYMMDE